MTLSSPTSSQHGGVFFYILIGVFLFAALSYAVATSMRGNTGVTNESYKLVASEIISTGNRFAEAVTRLRIKGVPKNAVSFENDIDLTYTNPNCSVDDCKVFANAGGGLSWETPPPNLTPAPWFISGGLAVDGVGTLTGDVVLYLSYVPAEVCSEINVLLGNTQKGQPVPYISASLVGLEEYTGTTANTLVTVPQLVGKKSGCVQVSSITGTTLGTALNAYHYYQVLIAN